MKVVAITGYSGSGKTQLIEQVIATFKAQRLRVSAVKHAHHRFDMDHPGKDSWRFREAGASEVVIASDQRLALLREFDRVAELSVHQMLAELSTGVDWVLVEGWRSSDLPKIEVWRAACGHQAHYPGDPFIAAVATDDAAALPASAPCPVLNLNRPQDVARWLLDNGQRFDYAAPQPLSRHA